MVTSPHLIDVSTAQGRAEVAGVRERFLEDQATDLTRVRPLVAKSWIRSAAAGVDPSSTYSRVEDAYIDEQALAVARPFLAELDDFARAAGGYVSLISPDGALFSTPELPGADQFPHGYSLSEEFCGTNGDGTALEEGRAVWVASTEHYRDDMQGTWCFTSLVKDPFRNRVRLGAGLTLPDPVAQAARPENTALILEGVVARIANAITEKASLREQLLLTEYLSAARKFSDCAVLAIDGKNSMRNRAALELVTDSDYPVVAGYAFEALAEGRIVRRQVSFVDGREFLLDIAPAGGDLRAGALIVARPAGARPARPVELTGNEPSDARSDGPQILGDLEGRSQAIRLSRQLAANCVEERRSAHLVGERGTDKLGLAQQIAGAMGHAVTLDCNDKDQLDGLLFQRVRDVLEAGDVLILRNVDALSVRQADQVAQVAREHRDRPVIVTMRRPTEATVAMTDALGSREISLTPLRTRREDIVLEVARESETLGATVSSRLLTVLTQTDWPGNEAQLRATLRHAARVSGGGELTNDHLPQSFLRGVSTGRLSRLEEAELFEMRNALEEAQGNRSKAAELLQIGRSTLYRRLDYFQRRGFVI